MQRELPGQWVLEGAYVASRSYDLNTDVNINGVPRQYLSTSNVRDNTVINSLTANVTNPFAGLIPGETLNNATTQRQNLLRPYPQFGNVDVRRYDGSSRFDSAQFRLERRFSGGYYRAGQLHLVELQGAGDQAERDRYRLRGAIPGHPPAASPGR